MNAPSTTLELPAAAAHSLAKLTKFHLALNVADLGRSIEFLRTLLGIEPAKCRPDYAKFELEDPPVVLSLEPVAPETRGALNHLGFRVANAEKLVEVQRRLEAAGIVTQREEGVECCYARQTKFWLHDPDGNLWEVYTLDEDLDHHGHGDNAINRSEPAELADSAKRSSTHENDQQPAMPVITSQPTSAKPAPARWSQRMGQPLPTKLFVLPETVDEAHLQGSFNVDCDADARRRVLRKVFQALKPGGQIMLHMLTGERELRSSTLQLPGPAAPINCVPDVSELTRELEAAGFDGLRFERFGNSPCFVRDGVPMRETIVTANKPNISKSEAFSGRVLYRGPFAELKLDDGTVLRRGQFVSVDGATYRRLRETGGEQFTFSEDQPLAAARDCGVS